MTTWTPPLSDLVAQRWGAAMADAIAGQTRRLDEAIAALAAMPSREPEPWPPALESPPTAPRLPAEPATLSDDATGAGIVTLAAAVRDGKLSSLEIIDRLLARIDAVEPEVRAWAALDTGAARTAARRRDEEAARGAIRGPLHGIPLGVKDIFDVAGFPTRANSALRAGAPPVLDDAVCVADLRSAGAIMLGKTATTEFAMADPSAACNPWRPAHTPGGSSSGSAAAVAARMIPGALGSQTAGSVLRPAAFCGIAGFKPSAGRISREGVIPLAWSLDHVGTLTRSVADAALLYQAMTGAATVETSGRPPRIGLCESFLGSHTDEQTKDTLRFAARRLQEGGAEVSPVDLGTFGEEALAVHQVIMAAEVAAFHLGAHGDHIDRLGPRLRALVQAGSAVPAQALLRAQGLRPLLARSAGATLAAHDALLVPSAPGPAPEGLASTGDAALNTPWSLIGVPAITIPVGLAANGLPLGMQLVAPFGAEDRLLDVAAWCERVIGFEGQT